MRLLTLGTDGIGLCNKKNNIEVDRTSLSELKQLKQVEIYRYMEGNANNS